MGLFATRLNSTNVVQAKEWYLVSDVVVASDGAGKEIRSYDVLYLGEKQYRLHQEFYVGFMNKLRARIAFLTPKGVVLIVRCDACSDVEACTQCKRDVRKYTARSSTITMSGERFYVKDINKTYITLKPCGGKMLKQGHAN